MVQPFFSCASNHSIAKKMPLAIWKVRKRLIGRTSERVAGGDLADQHAEHDARSIAVFAIRFDFGQLAGLPKALDTFGHNQPDAIRVYKYHSLDCSAFGPVGKMSLETNRSALIIVIVSDPLGAARYAGHKTSSWASAGWKTESRN